MGLRRADGCDVHFFDEALGIALSSTVGLRRSTGRHSADTSRRPWNCPEQYVGIATSLAFVAGLAELLAALELP